jgi:hypothetical protein
MPEPKEDLLEEHEGDADNPGGAYNPDASSTNSTGA